MVMNNDDYMNLLDEFYVRLNEVRSRLGRLDDGLTTYLNEQTEENEELIISEAETIKGLLNQAGEFLPEMHKSYKDEGYSAEVVQGVFKTAMATVEGFGDFLIDIYYEQRQDVYENAPDRLDEYWGDLKALMLDVQYAYDDLRANG